jgi:murein DD-endopeptidase
MTAQLRHGAWRARGVSAPLAARILRRAGIRSLRASDIRVFRAIAVVIPLVVAGCASLPGAAPSPAVSRTTAAEADRAAAVAASMVGKPYRYGGSAPSGFDCSGLVNFSFGKSGVPVSRDTALLREQARPISTAKLRRGDLLFFDQGGKKFSHVGIYLGDERFVHAPSTGGRVRIDRLDSEYWRAHFLEARRI